MGPPEQKAPSITLGAFVVGGSGRRTPAICSAVSIGRFRRPRGKSHAEEALGPRDDATAERIDRDFGFRSRGE